MVAVSVDTTEESARLAEKLGLGFMLLSDTTHRAMTDWGLVHRDGMPGGGTIMRPGVFLVEADGMISWRRLTDNYRVRLHPEEILEVLERSD